MNSAFGKITIFGHEQNGRQSGQFSVTGDYSGGDMALWSGGGNISFHFYSDSSGHARLNMFDSGPNLKFQFYVNSGTGRGHLSCDEIECGYIKANGVTNLVHWLSYSAPDGRTLHYLGY